MPIKTSQEPTLINVETLVAQFSEDKLRKSDKDLEKIQDYVSIEYFSSTKIPIIENLRKLINNYYILEVVSILSNIVDDNI